MGKGSSKMEVTEFYLSMHVGFCAGPVDELLSISVGEKVAWSGKLLDHDVLSINRPDLFGGVKKEGGVKGIVDYLPGGQWQILQDYLANKLGLNNNTAPGYRGIASLFFHGGAGMPTLPDGGLRLLLSRTKGFYWTANTPYLKSIRAKFARAPVGLRFGVSRIYRGNEWDANPAHIIFECMTNSDWGMGASVSQFDLDSFHDAAQTLYDEKLGLSLMWANQSTIESFVNIIINHIEAVLFVNPRTGLFTLKLIRADYDIDDLPVITPDNATIQNFQRKLWGETVNEIVVSWTNPDNEETETVVAQDLANIAMQGAPVSETKDYTGVRSADLAMQLAMRDLRVASAPMVSCDIFMNRQGWDITPGSVVVLHWPEHSIERLVMRVGPVDYGRTTDSTIKLSVVEDVFGMEHGEFTSPPGTEWVSTSEEPRKMDHSLIFTAPYYLLANSGADNPTLDFPDTLAVVLGAQNSNDTNVFVPSYLGSDPSGSSVVVTLGELSIVSRGLLLGPLPFQVNSSTPLMDMTEGDGPVVGGFVVLGASDRDMEICVITDVREGDIHLRRGAMDTTPKDWPVGTPIWFIGVDDVTMPEELHQEGSPVEYNLRTVTSTGTLEFDPADMRTGTMSARPWLPIRPANVYVGDVRSGTFDAGTDTGVSVSWSIRNRLVEDSVLLAWSDPGVTPELGQTTSIIVEKPDGEVITTIDGLTGEAYMLDTADFNRETEVVVRVIAKRAGFSSIQGHAITVLHEPPPEPEPPEEP